MKQQRLLAMKIVWVTYATVGSVLFAWDQSATHEHILGDLIVAAYSLPTSYLVETIASPFFPAGTPLVLGWLAILLNGGLFFAIIWLVARTNKAPIQSDTTQRARR